MPDRVFDKQWADAMLTRVHSRLDEADGNQRTDLHRALKAFLTVDPSDDGYNELVEQFGMTRVAARVAVFRVREKFRKILRQEIASTLEEGEDVNQEIDQLLDALKS